MTHEELLAAEEEGYSPTGAWESLGPRSIEFDLLHARREGYIFSGFERSRFDPHMPPRREPPSTPPNTKELVGAIEEWLHSVSRATQPPTGLTVLLGEQERVLRASIASAMAELRKELTQAKAEAARQPASSVVPALIMTDDFDSVYDDAYLEGIEAAEP